MIRARLSLRASNRSGFNEERRRVSCLLCDGLRYPLDCGFRLEIVMRLPRPYIPWSVREQVIDRQMAAHNFMPTWAIKYVGSTEKRVRLKLEEFFPGITVELHHRPALCNRQKIYKADLSKSSDTDNSPFWRFEPDANDPAYLVYLRAGAGQDHDVETRVRGLHGQHSDLGLLRKRKRKERRLKHPRGRLRSRGFAKRPPQRSASRPIAR